MAKNLANPSKIGKARTAHLPLKLHFLINNAGTPMDTPSIRASKSIHRPFCRRNTVKGFISRIIGYSSPILVDRWSPTMPVRAVK